MHKGKIERKLIARLQYFADNMNQRKQEKERISLGMNKGECKEIARNQIILYEEIIEEYHDIFKEILYENN